MLTGEYKHSVDAKNRLFIPAKHREELGPSFMIVRDIRGSRLKVFSMEAWEAYLAPIREKERSLAEEVFRYLHGGAVNGEPDAQGRVMLNRELLAHAKIDKEAMIVGCGDFAEIWSVAEYEAKKESENVEALRTRLEALGL